MKKAIFAGIVVLLALTLVTCDGVTPVEEDDTGKPEIVYRDGQPWGVNLTVNVPRARSASGDIASLYSDYYEVVFYDGVTAYRARWREPQKGRIAVPFGTYALTDPTSGSLAAGPPAVGATIMFAGRFESKSLLGVGALTSVNSAPGTTIDANTTSVTFTLKPLSANVQADPTSSFKVLFPSSLATSSMTSTTFRVLRDTNPISSQNVEYPIFLINGAAAGKTTATYTIVEQGGATFPYNTAVIVVDGTALSPPEPTVAPTVTSGTILSDVPPNTRVYPSFKLPDSDVTFGIAADGANSIAAVAFPTAATSAMPASGIIPFTIIPTQAKSGLTWITFEIPVRAMVAAKDINGDTWYIRSGLRETQLDMGDETKIPLAKNSLGGKILLGTNDINDFAVAGNW